MVLEIVVAAAAVAAPAATQGAPSPTPVSPLTVTAQPKSAPPADATVDVPADDTVQGGIWASVWPETAYRARIPGHVTLTCDIDRYGLAERCQVAYESPPGKGFGAAALALRPTFKLKPRMGPEGPEAGRMNIAIEFKPPDPQFDFGANREGGSTGGGLGSQREASDLRGVGNPLPRRSVAILNNPVWAAAASYDDMTRAYPTRAGATAGYAVSHCRVERNGRLGGCQITREDPERHGFGRAALSLAEKFQVAPEWTRGPGGADVWVDIPFRFTPPDAAEPRTVTSPYWLTGFDPDQALKIFPPEAAAKGLTSGHGVARCVVMRDGSLSACAPDGADPDGLGFAEAAARLASTMRMNLWTADGVPVDGATVRVAVQLNLK